MSFALLLFLSLVQRGAYRRRPIPSSPRNSGLLATYFLRRLLHFLRTHIANMSGDRPLMTERVFQFARTIAPERVLGWHRNLRPRRDGMLDDGVDIFDLKVDCHG